ncbi:helix-turn-helix domain-containing protein [Thermus hydrothermalis]|uniref:helix-turn-helix domain-containing protein n=1 Tax=Thermus hydrothermalis TaxID=2908148 RepID=UPI001FAA94B1|nr:helix-turn-helix domain-containing protein [Thermus hydrothermalis]
MGPDKPLLTPKEVAFALGVGRPAVEELIRSGRLQAVRVGRRLYVPASSLEAFLNPVVEAREVARLLLGLMERAGLSPRLGAMEEGFVARAGGVEATDPTPTGAVIALARKLVGEVPL